MMTKPTLEQLKVEGYEVLMEIKETDEKHRELVAKFNAIQEAIKNYV